MPSELTPISSGNSIIPPETMRRIHSAVSSASPYGELWDVLEGDPRTEAAASARALSIEAANQKDIDTLTDLVEGQSPEEAKITIRQFEERLYALGEGATVIEIQRERAAVEGKPFDVQEALSELNDRLSTDGDEVYRTLVNASVKEHKALIAAVDARTEGIRDNIYGQMEAIAVAQGQDPDMVRKNFDIGIHEKVLSLTVVSDGKVSAEQVAFEGSYGGHDITINSSSGPLQPQDLAILESYTTGLSENLPSDALIKGKLDSVEGQLTISGPRISELASAVQIPASLKTTQLVVDPKTEGRSTTPHSPTAERLHGDDAARMGAKVGNKLGFVMGPVVSGAVAAGASFLGGGGMAQAATAARDGAIMSTPVLSETQLLSEGRGNEALYSAVEEIPVVGLVVTEIARPLANTLGMLTGRGKVVEDSMLTEAMRAGYDLAGAGISYMLGVTPEPNNAATGAPIDPHTNALDAVKNISGYPMSHVETIQFNHAGLGSVSGERVKG